MFEAMAGSVDADLRFWSQAKTTRNPAFHHLAGNNWILRRLLYQPFEDAWN
jgi:hypothetical protein